MDGVFESGCYNGRHSFNSSTLAATSGPHYAGLVRLDSTLVHHFRCLASGDCATLSNRLASHSLSRRIHTADSCRRHSRMSVTRRPHACAERKSWPMRIGLTTGLIAILARVGAPFSGPLYFAHLAWAGNSMDQRNSCLGDIFDAADFIALIGTFL